MRALTACSADAEDIRREAGENSNLPSCELITNKPSAAGEKHVRSKANNPHHRRSGPCGRPGNRSPRASRVPQSGRCCAMQAAREPREQMARPRSRSALITIPPPTPIWVDWPWIYSIRRRCRHMLERRRQRRALLQLDDHLLAELSLPHSTGRAYRFVSAANPIAPACEPTLPPYLRATRCRVWPEYRLSN
jgi:hypothetical protein